MIELFYLSPVFISYVMLGIHMKIKNEHLIAFLSKSNIKDVINYPEDINELIKTIDEKQLKHFLKYLTKLEIFTAQDNVKNVYRNMNSVKLKKSFFYAYDPKYNEINFRKKDNIEYEFLSLASSYYDQKNDIIYNGFEQIKDYKSIGNGINSGYTELLAQRIFGINKIAHKPERKIVKLLEYFFDDPKMLEQYYFNHDLPGLIHHLENFAPRNEVIKLIVRIDCLSREPALFGINRSIDNLIIQNTLYNWLKDNHKNLTKWNEFERLVFQNKILFFIKCNQRLKLIHENKYVHSDEKRKKKRK